MDVNLLTYLLCLASPVRPVRCRKRRSGSVHPPSRKRNALALNGLCDNCHGLAVNRLPTPCRGCRKSSCSILCAVALVYRPAEGFPFVGEGLKSHNRFGGAVYHEAVSVHDGDKVCKLVVGRRHHRFVVATLVAFAVAKKNNSLEVLLKALLRPGPCLRPWELVPERAGAGVAAFNLLAVGVHSEGGHEVVEVFKFVNGEIASKVQAGSINPMPECP